MTQWHMMPSHPPGSLLARAATPCPWCALTIKRPKLHAPSCLMVHIAGLEAVRQVCQNDVRDDAGTGAPADVCRDTPLLDGHPGRHSRQAVTRGRAGQSTTAEAEAQPREGSRQRPGNGSPGQRSGTSPTATQDTTVLCTFTNKPLQPEAILPHMYQVSAQWKKRIKSSQKPSMSLRVTIFQALLLELKSRLQKIVGSEENKGKTTSVPRTIGCSCAGSPVRRVSSRCRIAACPTAVSWNTSRSWRRNSWWKAGWLRCRRWRCAYTRRGCNNPNSSSRLQA